MRLIPLNELHEWMPEITKTLDHFVKDAPGYDYEQELITLFQGYYRVWDMGNRNIVVTELAKRPRPILWVRWLMGAGGGDSFDDDLYEGLVEHAKDCGAEAVEFAIRRGFRRSKWAKKYTDMKHVADFYCIDLRD